MTKHIFKSKTFWLATIQAIVGILVVVDTNYPGMGWMVIAKSIADIILRYITVVPVVL